MKSAGTTPSLFLVLMGSMDCFTTAIGVLYFGAMELNPLIADLVNTNLPAFVLIKLTETIATAAVFVFGKKKFIETTQPRIEAIFVCSKNLNNLLHRNWTFSCNGCSKQHLSNHQNVHLRGVDNLV